MRTFWAELTCDFCGKKQTVQQFVSEIDLPVGWVEARADRPGNRSMAYPYLVCGDCACEKLPKRVNDLIRGPA